MKHVRLGTLDVGRIALGAMGMSSAYTGAGTDETESIRTIHRALDLGGTLIDTAEADGPYTNEELVGRAIKDRRDQVVLATKFGWISHVPGGGGGLDSRPENVRAAVEGSLRRLGTDHIDLCYQHPWTRMCRSGTSSARLGISSARARSITSACPRHGSTRSVALMAFTPSPHCSRSTRCGPATPSRRCCRCCVSWGSASCRTRRSATASSPEGSARSTTSPTRLAQDEPQVHGRELPAQPSHRRRSRRRRRRGRRNPCAGRARLAAREGRRHRSHPWHQARCPRRGEHRQRQHRAIGRAGREARQSHPCFRGPPQRNADAAARALMRPRTNGWTWIEVRLHAEGLGLLLTLLSVRWSRSAWMEMARVERSRRQPDAGRST
jgi:Aldo/keto reductase family